MTRVYTQGLKLILSEGKQVGIIEGVKQKDVARAMQSLGWVLNGNDNNWFWQKEEK